MTPKEKAIELVGEYVFLTVTDFSDKNFEQTKKCALIAVDELLNYIERINNAFNLNLSDTDWQEVKQEINKL